jgi:outer membrane protein assembly factor BamA
MAPVRRVLSLVLVFPAAFLSAQCSNDHRTNKDAGIQITDFTITGTQTISATDLARMTTDFIGSCFDEDSEELEERVRASFQNRGYFKAEVKSLRVKPRDPLGIPKPVLLDGDIAEGPQYTLADVSFLKNHAFPAEELRRQFPIKKGDLVERDKIASGLESLRKLYGSRGYLDYLSIPETEFGSNATVNLNITIEEGPQYHMGKLEMIGEKELAARLRAEWKLPEGEAYDNAYLDEYLSRARDLLPPNFSKANIQAIQNCPESRVEVRMILDSAEDRSRSQPKNIPCEEHAKTP